MTPDKLPAPPCRRHCSDYTRRVYWETTAPYRELPDGDLAKVPQSGLTYEVTCSHTGRAQPLQHMDDDTKQAALQLYYAPALF